MPVTEIVLLISARRASKAGTVIKRAEWSYFITKHSAKAGGVAVISLLLMMMMIIIVLQWQRRSDLRGVQI